MGKAVVYASKPAYFRIVNRPLSTRKRQVCNFPCDSKDFV